METKNNKHEIKIPDSHVTHMYNNISICYEEEGRKIWINIII